MDPAVRLRAELLAFLPDAAQFLADIAPIAAPRAASLAELAALPADALDDVIARAGWKKLKVNSLKRHLARYRAEHAGDDANDAPPPAHAGDGAPQPAPAADAGRRYYNSAPAAADDAAADDAEPDFGARLAARAERFGAAPTDHGPPSAEEAPKPAAARDRSRRRRRGRSRSRERSRRRNTPRDNVAPDKKRRKRGGSAVYTPPCRRDVVDHV
jgi:hypothetical protein